MKQVKNIITYEVKGKNIKFYSRNGVELGVLPLESSKEEFDRFFYQIQDIKEPVEEIIPAPYTASDIFMPSGRLRGINLTRDEFGSVRNASFIVDGKLLARIDTKSTAREANIKYLILRIFLHYKIDDQSITALLVETSFREMLRLKLEKQK